MAPPSWSVVVVRHPEVGIALCSAAAEDQNRERDRLIVSRPLNVTGESVVTMARDGREQDETAVSWTICAASALPPEKRERVLLREEEAL
jgi:hypothetical protein